MSPSPSASAATSRDGEPIAWTPEWLAKCPAVPNFPLPPLADDAAALWEALRRGWQKPAANSFGEVFLERHGLGEVAALLDRPEPPASLTTEEAARLLALLPGDGRVADFLALRDGAEKAVATLLTALDFRDRDPRLSGAAGVGVAFSLAPWLTLRRRLQAAPPEVAAAARALAEGARARASREHQFKIALLFPGEPWGAELAADAITRSHRDQGHGVAGLLLDSGSFEATREFVGRVSLGEIDLWSGRGLPQGLLARFGAAGAEILAMLHAAAFHNPGLRAEILEAWAAVTTHESYLALLERLDQREVGIVVQRVFSAHPGPAIAALADFVARRGKNADLARPLLRSLAASHPEQGAAALERIPAAGAALLRRLLDEFTRPVVWAPPESWPPSLAAPPWERPGRRRPAEAGDAFDGDPLELAPAKAPKAPAFWQPAGLPAPRLRSGESLPAAAVERLRAMLAFTRHDRPYAGLAQVREACDRASLAAFAWALFESFLAAGGPAKEIWALMALGHLGDDGCARRLAPLVRAWPGESLNTRAAAGIEVLAMIGSDASLMALQMIADKVKFKGLRDRARRKIEEIAAGRGLSGEELADRLAPDFGLDEDGSLELDFGARRFRVAFDEQLRPFVLDEQGQRLAALPRAGKNDDAAAAAAATATWKGLKEDSKSLAGLQLGRLEQAMESQRRFPREVFEECFARHPLIRHLARRLVWAAHPAAGGTAYFRIAEDGTYADAGDEAWQLPEDGDFSLPHPVLAPPEVFAAFAGIFADYAMLQPFPQLHREVYRLSDEEKRSVELASFAGREVPTGRLFGLFREGWRRGGMSGSGLFLAVDKAMPAGSARLHFHDGIGLSPDDGPPLQTLGTLSLFRAPGDFQEPLTFAALSRIEASELLRDVTRLYR